MSIASETAARQNEATQQYQHAFEQSVDSHREAPVEWHGEKRSISITSNSGLSNGFGGVDSWTFSQLPIGSQKSNGSSGALLMKAKILAYEISGRTDIYMRDRGSTTNSSFYAP